MNFLVCVFLLLTVSLCTFSAQAQSCNQNSITNLRIVTDQVVFGINSNGISLPPITVYTQGSMGQWISNGTETVTMQPPSNLTITGTATYTTSGGQAVFTGLAISGSGLVRGTYYVGFNLCNGVRVDNLQIVIRANDAATIRYVTEPLGDMTSYGYIPVRPSLAYYDAAGAITDIPSLTTWELAINDTSVTVTGHQVTPTLTSGQIVAFPNFTIYVTAAHVGKVFALRLNRIGTFTSANSTIPFPTLRLIRVVKCNADFTYSPADDRASIEYFNILPNTGAISLRGWAFLPALNSTLACKYNGLQYPMYVDDLCTITCHIPKSLPPNRGYPFDFSFNGVNYSYIANVSILDTSRRRLFETSAGTSNLYVFRHQNVTVTGNFQVVDAIGNYMYRFFQAFDPLYPSSNVVTCNTTGYYARLNRLSTTFYDPIGEVYVTPNNTQPIVNGAARITFAFGNNLYGDTYPYCCHAAGVESGCVNVNVLETCPSPPFVINVTSTRCTTLSDMRLVNCSTQGLTDVIITGGNFGNVTSLIEIRVGPYLCGAAVHDPIEPGRILYGKNCKGFGQGHTVYVLRPWEKIWGKWDKTYSFAVMPVVESISGCKASYYPSTALCTTAGTDKVTIRGSNFGNFGAIVYLYYYIPPGEVTRLEPALANITHVNDTYINVTGIIGQGSRFAVAVRALWQEETVNQYVTLSFTYTAMTSCPLSASGAMCNAKGNCDFSTGFCSCFAEASRGFWTSLNCTTCQPYYSQADCKVRCPVDSFGVVCSNRGRCDDGVTGTGSCFCNTGYGGLACNVSCPGGSANPCRGRGVCIQNVAQPYCECYSNSSLGFFSGTQCESCQTLYTGSTCKQLCPSNYLNPGVPCLGTGTCYSTATSTVCVCPAGTCGASCEFSGSDCGVCPAGQFGTNCTNYCPGYPNVCNNNGTCLEGARGSGVCICTNGYSGANCTVRCPGSNATSSCSGHGVCDADNGVCFCNAYWATSDCSVPCPGLLSNTTGGICSGNGACNIVTGQCACIQGYTGDRCQTICNGGIFSPCSFHGKCQSNGTCVCDNNATAGYFTGASCALCQDSWFGATCNQQCVKINNVQCNGKGTCTASLQCKCYSDVILGFWAEPNCAQCKPNYYGPACNIACPGGACNVCSGNGVCFDGINGTGLCNCFSNSTAGYWIGAKCSNCAPLYFGRTCTTKCPVDGSNMECSGHGICSQGIVGTGLCACNATLTLGYWGGTACNVCRSGYYGPNCTQRCPGLVSSTGAACSGHGVCNDGFNGTGVCTCTAGYGLADCSSGCPISQFQPCGGHGLCLDGASRNGTCQCFNNATYGFWTNAGCTACTSGYYGVSCILRCPRALGKICSGHGICNDGTAGTGRCVCDSGYSGTNCARPCDGGALSPCSGHGTCNQDTGRCTCASSATFGFWSGRNCTTCNPLFRSSDCTVACPVAASSPTVACSGIGQCFEGICFDCQGQTCGDACELSGSQCASFCDPGKYGANCENTCPGFNAADNSVCSAKGVCSQGRTGTGRCRCFNGYWGTDCNGICPGGAVTPCSNLGQCTASGTCTCVVGYGLADCSGRCPGGPTNVCFGNGVCNLASVTCTCLPGYVGSDCSRECPGGAQNPCTGHGTCDSVAGTCSCVNDAVSGHWTNANCSGCLPGYHGANCLKTCVNGATQGTTCVCSQYWSGPNCDQPCPGTDLMAGTVCSGHGTCLWGQNYTTGICVCNEDYFTTTCGTFCTAAACAAAPFFLINGMCNATTGQCVCVNNNVDGHWADTTTRCRTCQDFYWGPKCLNSCPCLMRGTCDQSTGACKCFDSDNLGHFAGDNCQQCATGYIGSDCRNVDVSISRQRPCSTIIDIIAVSQFSLADPANGILLAGGRPIIICNLSSRLFVSSYDFNATVVSGMLINGNYILTMGDIDGQPSDVQQQFVYKAARRPTFVPITIGAPFTVSASTAAIMSVGSERRLMSHRSGMIEASLMGMADPMEYISGAATPRELEILQAAERSGRRMGPDTARKLSAAAVFTSPVIMEQIAIGSSIILVFSNGIVQNLTNLLVVTANDFSSTFDQIQGADITRTVLISPALLILGGYRNGHWVLASVPLPLVNNAPLNVFTSQVESITSLCSTSGCTSTGKVITDGTSVITAVLTNTGAALLRYRYSQAIPGVITSVDTSLVMADYTDVIVNVTAMYLDTVGGAGYVAMNLYSPGTGMQPSTIYRFSLVTLAVYGSVAFQKVVNSYEIVTSLTADAASRTLYATVPLQLQISIVPLNLYAVTKIFPTIADTYGGTIVTVTGEGFADVAGLQCDFNGVFTLGEYISSQEIHCTAPTGGDERCEGVPLEVSISEAQFTNNGLRLRRVSSARVTSVYNQAYQSDGTDNAYGPQTGGAVVVLLGFGFQQTIYLSCRFKADNEVAYGLYADEDYQRSSGAQGTRLDNVIFVNSTMVLCVQPAMPFPTSGTTSLELSLDGTVYSRSLNPYEAVGAPVGLRAFRRNSEGIWIYNFNDTYVSSERVDINPFNIFVVDSASQRVRKLDTLTRNISMSLGAFTFQSLTVGSSNAAFDFASYCQYNETIRQYPIFYATGQAWNTTSQGQAWLAGGYVLRPPAGTYYMLFQESLAGWKYNFTFTVTVGAAARLKVCQQPSSSTNNLQPTLKRQPVLYAEDAAGNQLTSAALSTLRVSATYTVEQTVTAAVNAEDQLTKTVVGVPITVTYSNKTESRLAQLQGNFLQFDGIEITGLYGNTYNIIFSSPGLPNITSTPISIEWCNNNTERALANPSVLMYFAKWGTSECFVCPNGALCDGTPAIQTYGNNYWRASSDSYVFYSCASPYSGESCLAPNGTCKPGYRGPRCSSCEPGYGLKDTYCEKCPSSGVMVAYTLLILVITFLFVAVSLLVSFTTYAVDALPAAIKLALNHFQVSSRIKLTQTYADPLADLFDVHFDISELVRFDAIPSECSPLDMDVYDRFFLTIAMPFIAIMFFSILLLGLYIYRRLNNIEIKNTPVLFSANSKNVRRERVMLVVARFMSRIRSAVSKHRGDVRRDDERTQFFTVLEYLMSMSLVVLLMIYPSIITWCLVMWKCESITMGDGATLQTVQVLIADRTIDCNADYHVSVKRWSLAAACFYGIIVPVAAFFTVRYWWQQFAGLHTRRLFTYYLCGYDSTMWWWETTVLLRKFVVVIVVMMVPDPILRTYLMMWVMAIALGLHGWFQPFDALRPSYYYLEGLGITTIVLTLNLSLLFQFTAFADGTPGYTALIVILLTMNIIVTAVFLLFLLRHLYFRIMRFWRGTEEEFAPEDPLSADRFIGDMEEGGDGKRLGTGRPDRRSVQADGVLGLLRKASTTAAAEQTADNKVVIDPTTVPVALGETPFERLKRLEAEKRKQFLRKDQAKTQASLEEELQELKERLARAEALAAAEEAVIRRNPHMAERRRQHEEELNRLMQLIRKERGEVKRLVDENHGLDNIQFEDQDDDDEDAFDIDDDY